MSKGSYDIEKLKSVIDWESEYNCYMQPRSKLSNCTRYNCPFHNDKTPSFVVHENGRFFCYGCKVQGDILNFLSMINSSTLGEVIQEMAQKYNLAPKTRDYKNRPFIKPKIIAEEEVTNTIYKDPIVGQILKSLESGAKISITKKMANEISHIYINTQKPILETQLHDERNVQEHYENHNGVGISIQEAGALDCEIMTDYARHCHHELLKYFTIGQEQHGCYLYPDGLKEAATYLINRGLDIEDIKKHGIGFDSQTFFAEAHGVLRDAPDTVVYKTRLNDFFKEKFNENKYVLPPMHADKKFVWKRLQALGLLRYQAMKNEDDGYIYKKYTGNFKNRLVFPIYNLFNISDNHTNVLHNQASMKIAGFTCRKLDDKKLQYNNEQAKWLHSQNSYIFEKRRTLFNSQQAFRHILKKKYPTDQASEMLDQNSIKIYLDPKMRAKSMCFIGEGPIDAIALAKIKMNNYMHVGSVATLGSMVSKEQTKLLNDAFAHKIVVFDNDEPGKEAAIKLFEQINTYKKSTFIKEYTIMKIHNQLTEKSLLKLVTNYFVATLDIFDWSLVSFDTNKKDAAEVLLEGFGDEKELFINTIQNEKQMFFKVIITEVMKSTYRLYLSLKAINSHTRMRIYAHILNQVDKYNIPHTSEYTPEQIVKSIVNDRETGFGGVILRSIVYKNSADSRKIKRRILSRFFLEISEERKRLVTIDNDATHYPIIKYALFGMFNCDSHEDILKLINTYMETYRIKDISLTTEILNKSLQYKCKIFHPIKNTKDPTYNAMLNREHYVSDALFDIYWNIQQKKLDNKFEQIYEELLKHTLLENKRLLQLQEKLNKKLKRFKEIDKTKQLFYKYFELSNKYQSYIDKSSYVIPYVYGVKNLYLNNTLFRINGKIDYSEFFNHQKETKWRYLTHQYKLYLCSKQNILLTDEINGKQYKYKFNDNQRVYTEDKYLSWNIFHQHNKNPLSRNFFTHFLSANIKKIIAKL